MTRYVLVAIAVALFTVATWAAWRAYRRLRTAPVVEPAVEPERRSNDEFQTMPIPMAQEYRAYIAADVLAKREPEPRPNWLKPLEKSRQARHEANRPGGVRALPPAEDTQAIPRPRDQHAGYHPEHDN